MPIFRSKIIRFLFFTTLFAVWFPSLAQKRVGLEIQSDSLSVEIQGIITDYKINHIGDLHGFELKNSEKKYIVFFPEHTAAAVIGIAEKGAEVWLKTQIHGHHNSLRLMVIKNILNAKNLDISEKHPSCPKMEGIEKIIPLGQHSYIIDRKGRVAGIADGKTVALFRLNNTEAFIERIKSTSVVRITGFERPKDQGYINSKFENIVYATAVEIDGITFLLK